MAGGFAHVLAVRKALERLEDWSGMPDSLRFAAGMYQPHVEVGAVSPDYPYMTLPPGEQGAWADAMHYDRTAAPVRAAVRSLRRGDPMAMDWGRAAAWLLGYAAHLATDLTIHPVVQAIVGPYEQNQTAHRVCEMNQDAFIWQFSGLGEIGLADVFQQAHRSVSEGDALDGPVKALWTEMLRTAYPDLFARLPPDFDGWHSGYCTIIDAVDESRVLPAFGRHILKQAGNAYPILPEVEDRFISGIPTPAGPMDYGAVFERAVERIGLTWSDLGRALEAETNAETDTVVLAALPDANLDTGETEAGALVAWRES